MKRILILSVIIISILFAGTQNLSSKVKAKKRTVKKTTIQYKKINNIKKLDKRSQKQIQRFGRVLKGKKLNKKLVLREWKKLGKSLKRKKIILNQLAVKQIFNKEINNIEKKKIMAQKKDKTCIQMLKLMYRNNKEYIKKPDKFNNDDYKRGGNPYWRFHSWNPDNRPKNIFKFLEELRTMAKKAKIKLKKLPIRKINNAKQYKQYTKFLLNTKKTIEEKRKETIKAFENFDQKSNQLFQILSTVMKSTKEMQSNITRNTN